MGLLPLLVTVIASWSPAQAGEENTFRGEGVGDAVFSWERSVWGVGVGDG